MADFMRATALTVLQWVVGFSLLGVVAGCDRLFGSGDTTDAVSAVAVVPPRPVVLSADIIATVNRVPISRHDLEMRVEELKIQFQMFSPEDAWKPLSAQEMESVMNELIEAELMSQHVAESGSLRSLETQRRWEFLRRRFLAEEWVRSNADTLVSSADIERYYEENELGFREPERVKLRHLVVRTETQASQALARFHGEDADFATLARDVSVGPTAANGGKIRKWLMRHNEMLFLYGSEEEASADGVMSLDPTLEKAAFAIDRSQGISNSVKGPDGRYHIFQLIEREEGGQRKLTEVWDWIKQALFVEKLQQVVDEFSAEAKIERFAERAWGVEQ